METDRAGQDSQCQRHGLALSVSAPFSYPPLPQLSTEAGQPSTGWAGPSSSPGSNAGESRQKSSQGPDGVL